MDATHQLPKCAEITMNSNPNEKRRRKKKKQQNGRCVVIHFDIWIHLLCFRAL